MIEKFLTYLAYEKRYSSHTIKSYHTDLLQLQTYLDSHFGVSLLFETNHEMLRSWMVDLIENDISTRSIGRKISAVKSFFKWGRKFEGLDADPTAKIKLPKVPKRLPVYVEEREMETITSNDFFDDTFEGKRDKLIIELLYQTGIRSGELIALKFQNIDFQKGEIKVLGKRNKERIVPVGEDIIHLMKEYNEIKALSYPETGFFFITQKGAPLYPKLVYNLVNSHLSKISSLQKKSPHVLRHTFATHMLNRGADLNAIKELLGHTSLSATQVYTHNSIEKLQEIHRKAHPKS